MLRHFHLILVIVLAVALINAAPAAAQTAATDGASQYFGLIAARGLADGAIPDPRASAHFPSPRPGASVAETVITLRKTGETVGTGIVWSESSAAGSLEFQEAKSPSGQTAVQYWVLAPGDARCVFTGQAAFAEDGHLLGSNFWRNDPEMRVAGSPDFPRDIFPNLGFPVSAVLRVLSAPQPGATGKLNMMMGPYGFMSFDMWAEDTEPITVRAGTFKCLKVIMRVDADSVMQGWPGFMKRLAQPFMPRNVFWFDTAPPHHLVKFVGAFGYPAPEVTAELTRVYVASAKH